jgi:hypothetical protein
VTGSEPVTGDAAQILSEEGANERSIFCNDVHGSDRCCFTSVTFPGANETVKECQSEWRANKPDNEAKGIKEKDYVARCRGVPTPVAAPKEAPATPAAASLPEAAPKNGKTAKECGAEWTANKADNQAKGITKKRYVAQCHTGGVAVPPKTAPELAPPPTPPAKRPTTTTNAPPPAAPMALAGAGQYRTEGEARGHCPTDTVVWVNLKSKIYHFTGTKNYGNTKLGAYACEREAIAQGDRASRIETHP